MLKVLVMKELKITLKDKKILLTVIITPLITFILMGGIMRIAMSATITSALKTEDVLYVVNKDYGNYSKIVLDALEKNGYKIKLMKMSPLDIIKRYENISLVMYIPSDFSGNLIKQIPATIEFYINIHGLSMSSYTSTSKTMRIESIISNTISSIVIKQKTTNLNPNFALRPIRTQQVVYFMGRKMPQAILLMLGFLISGILIVPLVMVSTAIGVSSSLIAMENEEKTLEVLLTLPISRFKILLSKLIGVLILVILSTISFMIGFIFYITSVLNVSIQTGTTSFTMKFNLASLLQILNTYQLILMGVSTFISLIAVSSIGILLGSLCPDVRSAQSYVGFLSFIVFMPAIILMFADLHTLPLSAQVIFLIISPFILPALMVKIIFEGITWMSLPTIAWSIAFTLIMVFIASKFMSSERILTAQFTIKLKRMKKLA